MDDESLNSLPTGKHAGKQVHHGMNELLIAQRRAVEQPRLVAVTVCKSGREGRSNQRGWSNKHIQRSYNTDELRYTPGRRESVSHCRGSILGAYCTKK